MKCFYFITIFVLVNSFTVCGQALTGDKTIGAGTGKNYNSIAAAIADLNSNGVGTGGVSFLVDAGHVETFTDDTKGKITITGTLDRPIIFKKSGIGNNPIINTAIDIQFESILTISGGDFITFDGIDVIENENNLNGKVNYGYKIENDENIGGACSNKIANCKISLKNDLQSQQCGVCIVNTNYSNNSNELTNISILKAKTGISIVGNSSYYCENLLIEGCTIGNETSYDIKLIGIELMFCENFILNKNIIKNIESSNMVYAISISSCPDNAYINVISNNKIYNIISSSNYNTERAIGIYIINSQNNFAKNYIYNNCISNISKSNLLYSTSFFNSALIIASGTSKNYIYHNSFYLSENSGASNRLAMFYSGSNYLYNNMFVNNSVIVNSSKHYCVASSSKDYITASDYNNYLTSTTLGKISTVDYASLSSWQSILQKESYSQIQNVFYKSTTDLHLDGTSIGNFDLAGMNLSSLGLPGYDKDIDGENRNISNPYMGADEDPTYPVPVEMATFEASKCGNFISLYWNTKTELNCIQFDIERRCEDESCWTYIATVPGHGNSYNFNEYSFIDNYSIGNKTQYRLKQIDNDGEYKYYYSNILDAELINNYELYGNYPNPFNPSTTISYNLQNEGEVIIKIYSISGELIQTNKEGMKSKGYNETKIDLNNYPSGIYLYQLEVFGINNLKIFDALKKMILVK